MHVHDLRSFLESVRKAGDLHEIRREVDPVRELGRVLAACERAGKAAYFHAVSPFYSRFPQLDDDEVIALLAANARGHG